jgi:hypothetical protein
MWDPHPDSQERLKSYNRGKAFLQDQNEKVRDFDTRPKISIWLSHAPCLSGGSVVDFHLQNECARQGAPKEKAATEVAASRGKEVSS